MIVAAHFSHERKKRSRRNKNREPISNNHERRCDAHTREQQHSHSHGDRRDQASQQTRREPFGSAHHWRSLCFVEAFVPSVWIFGSATAATISRTQSAATSRGCERPRQTSRGMFQTPWT